MNLANLPQSVRNTLWSYDHNVLDLQKNKNLIIFSVLNLGTFDAVIWLYNTYRKEEISNSIEESNSSNWSTKSLSYWSKIFSVVPKKKGRFV